jgi:hypothetical protein
MHVWRVVISTAAINRIRSRAKMKPKGLPNRFVYSHIMLLTVEEISARYRHTNDDDERARLFAVLPYALENERLKLELMGREETENVFDADGEQ